MTDHAPAPWWYRLLARLFPKRVREIPEANNPDRIVLRQFAIIRQFAYVQAFASGEDPDWYHSHQWRWLAVLVLWGSYTEKRRGREPRRVTAPALYVMGPGTRHQVTAPVQHTSIAIGFGRDESLRRYFHKDDLDGLGIPWTEHVKKMTARL